MIARCPSGSMSTATQSFDVICDGETVFMRKNHRVGLATVGATQCYEEWSLANEYDRTDYRSDEWDWPSCRQQIGPVGRPGVGRRPKCGSRQKDHRRNTISRRTSGLFISSDLPGRFKCP